LFNSTFKNEGKTKLLHCIISVIATPDETFFSEYIGSLRCLDLLVFHFFIFKWSLFQGNGAVSLDVPEVDG